MEEGTRALLQQSGLSYKFCIMAALFWIEHWNRVDHEGAAPFTLRFGVASDRDLKQFGSLTFYLKEKPSPIVNVPKFEPRGEPAVIVGYGSYNSICVLRLAPFVQTGKISFRRTRDFRTPAGPPRFPIADLMREKTPEVSWHFLLPFEQESENEDGSAATPLPEGVTRCRTCSKLITELSVTCPACQEALAAPRRRLTSKTPGFALHDDGVTCGLRRCSCVNDDVVLIEPPAGAQPSIAELRAASAEDDPESHALADDMIDRLVIGENLPPPPSTVGDSFEEPDVDGLAAAAKAIPPPINYAMVYRPVRMASQEAKTPGAIAAIEKEFITMQNEGVFAPFAEVQEMTVVQSNQQDANFVRGHLLLGRKDSELQIEGKWKARFVAGGNNVWDADGLRAAEEQFFGAPATLDAVRIVCWWSTRCGSSLKAADVDHAYLQAMLGGPPIYILLPKELWPSEWNQMNLQAPVLQLRRAIYGLKRSGFDWQRHANAILVKRLWSPVKDVAEGLFSKKANGQTLLLAIYVDDLLASGNKDELDRELEILRNPIS